MPKTVILGAARTPVRQDGRRPRARSTPPTSAARRSRPRSSAPRWRPTQVQHVVFGQVLQAGPGPDPQPPGPDQGRDPQGGLLGDGQQGLRLGACARRGSSTRPSARATSTSAVAGGMESMSQRALPAQAGALRLPDGRRQGARRDDQRRPDQPVQRQAHGRRRPTEVGEELEMTRADMDKFALRSHELAIQATDEGRLPEEIVAGDDQVEEGRHDGRGRRGAAPRHLARVAREAAAVFGKDGTHTAGNAPGVNDGAGALVLVERRVGEAERPHGARDDRRPGRGRRRLPLPRAHARERHQGRAREGRPVGRRHRPVRDQRGVRLGRAQLDAHARRRRVEGQRQRRRDRARPPDRRQRRAHPRLRSSTSCAAAAAASAWRRSAPAAARATP